MEDLKTMSKVDKGLGELVKAHGTLDRGFGNLLNIARGLIDKLYIEHLSIDVALEDDAPDRELLNKLYGAKDAYEKALLLVTEELVNNYNRGRDPLQKEIEKHLA